MTATHHSSSPASEASPEQLRFAELGKPALHRSRLRTLGALALFVTGVLVTGAVVVVVAVMSGAGALILDEEWGVGPLGLLAGLLLMPLLLLPSAMLTSRWSLRMSPGQVCSVAGRFRWPLFWSCTAVSMVVVVAVTLVSGAWSGTEGPTLPPQWPLVLLAIAVGVPIAAFAEEFAFRGVLTHILGARWTRPLVSVAVPAVVTATLFSLLHGPAGAAPFLVHAAGGVAFAVLCDRTGGLEASTAAHTAWNASLFLTMSLWPVEGAEAAGAALLPTLLTDAALVVGLLLFTARRPPARLTEAAR